MAERELAQLGCGAPLSAARFGLKAAWLDCAHRSGENVPAGLALSARFARTLADGDQGAYAALSAAWTTFAANAETLAVRASPDRSLPGALLTRLSVAAELPSIVEAVREVVQSAAQPQVVAQLSARSAEPPSEPWVSVLIQRELLFQGASDLGAVALTHDPRSGEPGLRGEYARGGPQQIVSGKQRPLPLRAEGAAACLAREQPDALTALEQLSARLLACFEEPLELELGFVQGRWFVLQVRALTLASRALLRVALVAIEADSPQYAARLEQLAERGLSAFSEQHFAEHALGAQTLLMRGLAASPGAAVGVVVTDVARAIERARTEPVILLRPDAVPEDVAAFRVARAVVTTSGGLTCHAAVIARGLSVPAIVGVAGVRIEVARGVVWGGRDTRELLLNEGDWVSVDARRGTLHRGQAALEPALRGADARALFAALRKLRPTPLWVMGDVNNALRLKDEASLDGALCSWPEQGELPPGSGRECWVEIDASVIEQRLPTLPRGWGVVVSGDLLPVSLPSLRALAPLRAIGARLDDPEAPLPEGALDLLVIGFAAAVPPQKRAQAPRLLQIVNFPERAPVPAGNNVGWLCPVSHVLLAALRYAGVRREGSAGRTNRTAISLAEEGEP